MNAKCEINSARRDKPLRLLFVGETWKGSSARSLREALEHLRGVLIDDIGEDNYLPKGRSYVVRAANRVLRSWYQAELADEIERRLDVFKPDVLLVYKGGMITAPTVQCAQRMGVCAANVFPDLSPHAHGSQLRSAMGAYDLVISTKPFHPRNWKAVYGYGNRCVLVPHGYDPAVHFWADAPVYQDVDVIMAATWRPQYERTMVELAQLMRGRPVSVSLAGWGWAQRRKLFPNHWQFPGGLTGRSYGDFLRKGKIVIAPVNTEVVIDGVCQPGDEDTTRTYELAAAGCFFLHRRTPYGQTIYDEKSEVPMWDDAAELATLVEHYLPKESERRLMAANAHRRAVPAYSIFARADAILDHLQRLIWPAAAAAHP
jgi:glycosyl transferase family 1